MLARGQREFNLDALFTEPTVVELNRNPAD